MGEGVGQGPACVPSRRGLGSGGNGVVIEGMTVETPDPVEKERPGKIRRFRVRNRVLQVLSAYLGGLLHRDGQMGRHGRLGMGTRAV